MTDFILNASIREANGKETRRENLIPAIVYGNGFENKKIAVSKIDFNKLYKVAGSSNLVDLVINEGKGFKTLVNDIQLDPIKSEIIHVDFLKVNMKEKLQTEIPLVFVGDSPAVMNLEGTLITPRDHVTVECLPSDLVPEIEVDISGLDDFEKDIRISDIKVSAGIEILDDAEEVIAHIEEPRSEAEMAELDEAVEENVDAVEVEHKGEEEASEGEEGEKSEEKKED